jgi:hypothetical protein
VQELGGCFGMEIEQVNGKDGFVYVFALALDKGNSFPVLLRKFPASQLKIETQKLTELVTASGANLGFIE